MSQHKYALVIHGGAGTILRNNMTPSREKAYRNALAEALSAGRNVLDNGGTAVHAVEHSVIVLEDSPLFNAGRGSVFTHDGKFEMDASIMDGKTLQAGSVAGISGIKNPISVARNVMENSPYVMLSGKGAEAFAIAQGLEFKELSYFETEERFEQLKYAKAQQKMLLDHDEELGTVGAVALDIHGNLAAATSTGGMTNKQYGRIGDSPIIGAGTYANNNTCALSCTGHGEHFMRNVVAYDISALLEYQGLSLVDAADRVINQKLKSQKGEGGLIAIDKSGQFVMTFNTEGMYRGAITTDHDAVIEIYQ